MMSKRERVNQSKSLLAVVDREVAFDPDDGDDDVVVLRFLSGTARPFLRLIALCC